MGKEQRKASRFSLRRLPGREVKISTYINLDIRPHQLQVRLGNGALSMFVFNSAWENEY